MSELEGSDMCEMEMEQLNRRKKLWDLPHNVHCQLIGLCFEDQELEKIAQRFGYQIEATTTPYELHRFFVCIAEQDLPLTRKLNQQLEKKFQVQIKQFKLLESTDEILAAWQMALQGSQMAGAFWAVITHKLTDLALLELVYGDLHMQAHKQNHSATMQRQQIERLKLQLQQLQEKSEKTQQKALNFQQKQQQKLLHLQQDNHKLKQQNSVLRNEQR